MYEITRKDGVVTGIRRLHDGAWSSIGGEIYIEALEKGVLLDVSDKQAEVAPIDIEAEELKSILVKQDKDVTAADIKTLVLKFMRRQVARGL